MAAKNQKTEDVPTAKHQEIIVTDYMRGCFEKVAIKEGFKDYTLKVNHGMNVGDGFVSNMLKISFEEKGRQLQVLVKIPVANKARREAMKMMSLFEREIFVYNVVMPRFIEIQDEHQVNDTFRFANIPKIYFAEYDKEIDEAIIIMEDLRDSDYKMWKKSIAVNFEHAQLLIKALARLHSLSFVMRSKFPQQFIDIQNLNDDFSDVLMTEQFQGFLKGSILRTFDYLKPDEVELREKVNVLIENLNDIVIEGVKPKYVEPYAVLLHGDCWINNYLYHYDSNGAANDIKLIDWQISRYGSPAIDLLYFFFICTDHELRVKHFDELIRIYYESLNNSLKMMDCDAEKLFPFLVLVEHLKRFGKFGAIMSTFIMPALLANDEQIVDLDYVMEQKDQNQMTEIADHVTEKMIKPDLFAKRIREVMLDAIDYGYM